MTYQPDKTGIDWLLGGDPAVVWQVERDLQGRAERTWTAARRPVPPRRPTLGLLWTAIEAIIFWTAPITDALSAG